MSKLKIAVLFGGASSEHDISLMSAYSVITNFDKTKYDIIPVGITKDGRWYVFSGAPDAIKDGSWEKGGLTRAAISPDAGIHGLVLEDGSQIRLDAVFPCLHGLGGEDGTVQGLLVLAGIPFVGCSVAASANCMEKITAKRLFATAGLPQCEYVGFDYRNYLDQKQPLLDRIEREVGYPVFIKPSRAGSSVGVSKANSRAELAAAIELAAKQDNLIVAERCVDAREIEAAVTGNRKADVSVLGEILPSGEFYDFNAKYIDNKSGLAIPADLPAKTADEIRGYAAAAYEFLGCEGLARVDFFVDRQSGRALINEINTIPGFTDISMFPKLRVYGGETYSGLLDNLVALALERGLAK